MGTRVAGVAWAALLVAGCPGGAGDDDDVADGDADADGDSDVGVVDLLVMMDNSNSMAQEQLSTTASIYIPMSMIAEVGRSLHVGVVSSDMGTRGYGVQTCSSGDGGLESGDDGVLRSEPSDDIVGCDESYPRYLSWQTGEDVDALDQDYACISTLGTGGCGFEQQLEAVRKALTVHADGANAGFLRPGSLLAILLVSDEEDCSVRADGEASILFDTAAALGPLNLRCHNYADRFLVPVSEFADSLLALRPGRPDRVLLAELVGIPPDTRHECALEDMTDENFRCLLDLPEMQEVIDESAGGKGERLTPSCDEAGLGMAFPPRRMVELARQIDAAGGTGLVRSVCEADFVPAMRAFADAIAARLGPR